MFIQFFYTYSISAHVCAFALYVLYAVIVAEFNKGIILPTLIRQLQSILQQYPDDGQILKVTLILL